MIVVYLCQFKHGFHGGFILHKVILYVSVISQISQTFDGPLPCPGVELGIDQPPEGKSRVYEQAEQEGFSQVYLNCY